MAVSGKQGLERWAEKNVLLANVVKRGLFVIMWLLFLSLTFFWWAQDTEWFGLKIQERKIDKDLDSGLFDGWEGLYLTLVLPLLIIYVLAAIYVHIPEPKPTKEAIVKRSKPPRWYEELGNSILLPSSFVGTLTFGEIFWSCVFLSFLFWKYIKYDLHQEYKYDHAAKHKLSRWDKLREEGIHGLGFVAIQVYYVLLIPVSRGSVILRLLDIPVERAVRYHRWLGYCLFFFAAGHGIGFISIWIDRGTAHFEMRQWQPYHVSYVPGQIAALLGLCILISSLGIFRRRNYELFYNLHMILFVLFSVFVFWHLKEFAVVYALPSLLLWGCDRFVRMVQRWGHVSVIATRHLPDGTIQVEVLRREDTYFWALQHLHVLQPKLSLFSWHPFSVESHPEDSARSMVIHIKPLGAWSEAMSAKIAAEGSVKSSPGASSGCPISFLKCEGPYGHTSDYFLRYPVLLLFAGGSGFVPFVPLIKEVLYRYAKASPEETSALPKEIIIVWSVKFGRQLFQLEDICPNAISPTSSPKITIQAYVTQESENESSLPTMSKAKGPTVLSMNHSIDPSAEHIDPINKRSWWQEVFVLAAVLLGHFFTQALFASTIIDPKDHHTYNHFKWWLRSTVYLAAAVISVLVWGGLSIFICHFINTRNSKPSVSRDSENKTSEQKSSLLAKMEAKSGIEEGRESLLSTANITYGGRPSITDVFRTVAEAHKDTRICTMASGPEAMNTAVAHGCYSSNGGPLRLKQKDYAYFSFHSVTFVM